MENIFPFISGIAGGLRIENSNKRTWFSASYSRSSARCASFYSWCSSFIPTTCKLFYHSRISTIQILLLKSLLISPNLRFHIVLLFRIWYELLFPRSRPNYFFRIFHSLFAFTKLTILHHASANCISAVLSCWKVWIAPCGLILNVNLCLLILK